MPTYVYGCDKTKEHPRENVVHPVNVQIEMRCRICGSGMHRIPQPFLFGVSPVEIIRDWAERNWSKKLRREPRDYKNISSQRGKPQKDYGARK